MSGVVKGFGCRPLHDGWDAAEGRRSKASRGGNRGGVEAPGRSRCVMGIGRGGRLVGEGQPHGSEALRGTDRHLGEAGAWR